MPKKPTARERMTQVEIELVAILQDTMTPLAPTETTQHLKNAIISVIHAKLSHWEPDAKKMFEKAPPQPTQQPLIENPRAGNGQLPPPAATRR